MTAAWWVLLSATLGAVLSSLMACLPGLHAYNVMGLLVLGLYALADHGLHVPPEMYLPFMAGIIVGWSMLNTIPSVLLGAPDESALFTVLPGQKYLMMGRGFEGAMITGVGGLTGAFLLVLVIGPLAPVFLPTIQSVLRDHVHWILWVVTVFILMSEWPKGGARGPTSWRRFRDAWSTLGAGLLTFTLSGVMGFILLYRSPISTDMVFQNIMPAFAGLFAVPWCLLNIISGTEVPPQRITRHLDLNGDLLLRGAGAGTLGGSFAAFIPVITGGIGGLLAGQATAQRDERVFILSQGVSKLIYYTGAFLLLFVPGLGITRGGGAWMVKGLFTPRTYYDYYMVLAAIAISSAVAFLMMPPLCRFTLWLIGRINYRHVSTGALAVIVGMVAAFTGWTGVAVMLVGAGIGMIPVLYGSRRLNGLGIILLPMACNMSGIGADVAKWLRLI